MPDSRFATEAANAAFSGYEGVIFDAYFAPGTYGTQLQLKVQLDHPELFPMIESGMQTVYFGVGAGWEVRGDGAETYHTSGPDKKIGAQSQYGLLLKRLESGKLENYQAFLDSIPADWSPYTARSWKGLRFRFDDVEVPTRKPKEVDGVRVKDDKGKDVWEEATSTRVMPTVFLGVKGSIAGNGKVESLTWGQTSLPDDMVPVVHGFLHTSPDYKTFLGSFKGDDFGKVFSAVPDKDAYEALKAGTADQF